MSDNDNILTFKCKKCNIDIDKKIGNFKICRLCHNAVFREKYTKIRIAKNFKERNGHAVEYIDEKGQTINVIIRKEIKECRICKKEKNYNEFGTCNSTYKGNLKKYISADCKDCAKIVYSNL